MVIILFGTQHQFVTSLNIFPFYWLLCFFFRLAHMQKQFFIYLLIISYAKAKEKAKAKKEKKKKRKERDPFLGFDFSVLALLLVASFFL